MGEIIKLVMDDGFEIGIYEQIAPSAKGAVVVIQEIFGVNDHIRSVADGYAAAGYHVLAPQLFDRVEPGIELGYDESGMGRGIDLAFNQLDRQRTVADLQAVTKHAGRFGAVGVVGFCFGGLLTWLCARDLEGISAASAYYGGGIPQEGQGEARCPTIMHFGDLDTHIPVADVEAFGRQRPEVEIFRYGADHGFNCDQRASFAPEAAKLAHARTLELFSKNLS